MNNIKSGIKSLSLHVKYDLFKCYFLMKDSVNFGLYDKMNLSLYVNFSLYSELHTHLKKRIYVANGCYCKMSYFKSDIAWLTSTRFMPSL